MSSLDYLDLCRLCLVKDRVSVPIFEDEGDVRQIFLKITACLPVKVSRDDKLPKKICDDCVYKVELFYQFWNTTASAEKQLLQWLGEVGGLEDKQGYVTEVLDTNVMKQERNSDNRLDGSVLQVSGHQNSMDMGMMDNISLITMPAGNEQQFAPVPIDTSGTVQTVQAVPGPSTQNTHDAMTQSQTSVSHLVEEEEESEEDENSDDGCDNEEGLPVKEETEDDQTDRPLEPTTFVSLPCDEAGPSGLQQQKISEISEMTMSQTTDGDPKTGVQTYCVHGPNNQMIFIKVKNEPETQQQQSSMEQVQLHQQQKQPLLMLQQSEQQQQTHQPFLLLQQSHQQQQSLLLLQQPHLEQQSILGLSQPQQQQRLIIIQSQQQLLHPKEQQESQVQQERQQQILDAVASPEDPLSQVSADVVPVKTLRKKARCSKSKISKSFKMPKPSKPVKTLKSISLISEAIESHQKHEVDSLKQQESTVPQKIAATNKESTFSSRELPSTSTQGNPTESQNLDISEMKADDGSDGDNWKDEDIEEIKDIFTRIDYGGYQCNICQLTRLRRRSILSHICGQHSHLQPFKCATCGKAFKRKYTLKVHQRTHDLKNTIESFPCEKCDYRTPNKVSLRYHYYRVHTNEYRFTCEHCGKRFKVKRELVDHLVMHSGEQHMCEICGKLYRGEHLLRAHRRVHLDIYKFQCVLCKKKLSTEESLNNHIKLHSRTYECDECGMKFRNKHNLIKHRNVHTREQAFPCLECGKIFADQPTQKVHSLIHAGVKPYRCNVCGLGFTQRTPMMLHWKKKHPGETEPPPPVVLKHIFKSIEEQSVKKKAQQKDK